MTMSHVIIKIPKGEHKKFFFVQKFLNFFVKKIVRINRKREKVVEAAEWLKKLCAGLIKWEAPGRKIMVRPLT